VQAEDYRDVEIPAFERAAQGGEARALLVVPDFGGMSGSAV
jgi:hypothetical protein